VSYLDRTAPPATSLLAAEEAPLKRASSSAIGSGARNVLALQSITYQTHTYTHTYKDTSFSTDCRYFLTNAIPYIHTYIHIHYNERYHVDFEALVFALEKRFLILILAHVFERRPFLRADRNTHLLYPQEKQKTDRRTGELVQIDSPNTTEKGNKVKYKGSLPK